MAHLDSCAFLTFLHASAPRVRCAEHGVRQVRLPWAEPHSRFTVLFERLAIDVLGACDVASAAGLLSLSWDEAWHLMDRAVTRGLAAKALAVPAHVGVDEKAAGKGQDYITVVSDLDAGTVQYIADERRQASLDGYFDQFTAEQLEQIQAVAMDMWEPFAASVPAHLSDADGKIVFDRYHLMGYLTKAVDTVRKQENRALLAAGDKSMAGSKYLWLYSAENLPERHQNRFAGLRACDLKTARAWAIKESLRHFWSDKRRGRGAKHFTRWYFWATHSRLKPIIDAAKTLKRHQAGLLLPTSPTESPTPAPKASTPASKPFASPPAATATANTSRPPSTSTSVDYSSTRPHHDPRTSRRSTQYPAKDSPGNCVGLPV